MPRVLFRNVLDPDGPQAGDPTATLWVDAATGDDSRSRATVAASGGSLPWATIGRAAWGSTSKGSPNSGEAAQAGDVVSIAAGTYSAPGTNDRHEPTYNPVNSGSSGTPIVFVAEGAVILQHTSSIGPCIGANGVNYIEWIGPFTIDEATALSRADTGPVVFNGCVGCVVDGAVLDGNGDPGYGDNHPGVRLDSSDQITVRNCTIHHFTTSVVNGVNGCGVQFYESDNAVIENNTIHDCGGGIWIKGPADVRSVGAVVRFNLVYNSANGGIVLGGAEDALVYQNVVRDSSDGLRLWDLTPAAVPTNCALVNNTIDNCVEGINLRSAVTVGITLQNNIITNASHIFYSEVTSAPADTASDRHMFGSYSSAFSQLSDGNRTLAQWRSDFSIDGNSIEDDPLYVNEAADDFRLSGASPALTVGRAYANIGGTTGSTIPSGAFITGSESIGAAT